MQAWCRSAEGLVVQAAFFDLSLHWPARAWLQAKPGRPLYRILDCWYVVLLIFRAHSPPTRYLSVGVPSLLLFPYCMLP